ncbi:MAG: hypothetical protein SGCHY_005068, partial [Lobulomycetales sp.]
LLFLLVETVGQDEDDACASDTEDEIFIELSPNSRYYVSAMDCSKAMLGVKFKKDQCTLVNQILQAWRSFLDPLIQAEVWGSREDNLMIRSFCCSCEVCGRKGYHQ